MRQSASPSFDAWFVAPLPPLSLLAITAMAWFAGAAYCQGYQALIQNGGDWPGALLWSAYSVAPWLMLIEAAKRSASLSYWRDIMLATGAIGAVSIGIEIALRTAGNDGIPPAYLMVMRRLPPMGVALLIIAIGRRLVADETGGATISGQRLQQLAPSVRWIAAADNYVELHFGDRAELLRMTLAEAQRRLEKQGFRRIHRRYIVNPTQVARVDASQGLVVLLDGTKLPVGRTFSTQLATPG